MVYDLVPVPAHLLKDLLVRFESNNSAAKLCRANFFDRCLSFAALVLLHMNAAITMYANLGKDRERVHYRCAHAVETARNFITLTFKFAAGMKRGHNGLEC